MPKGRRGSGRLGWGEYQPAGPNLIGRIAFMEAVLRQAPNAFDDLIAIEAQMTGGVEDRLTDWARKWRLGDSWIIDIARSTLQARRELEARRIHRQWFFPSVSVMAPDWPELSWDSESAVKAMSREQGGRGWDPEMETEAAFRQRVERHIERIHTIAAAAGLVRATEKRTPAHFDWLALYQVRTWTEARIVEKYQNAAGFPDLSGVSRAITKTAALIGLSLRRSRGLRPTTARRH